MGNIIAVMRAVLTAITAVIWVPCRITGRLIRKIQRAPQGPTIPSEDMSHRSVRGPSNENVASQVASPTGAALAVKQLAQRMAAGTVTMQDMHAVDADVVKWLASLDHQQLCRLVCAEDLGGYMYRRTEIRGLPRYLEHPPRPPERRTDEPRLAYIPAPVAAVAI